MKILENRITAVYIYHKTKMRIYLSEYFYENDPLFIDAKTQLLKAYPSLEDIDGGYSGHAFLNPLDKKVYKLTGSPHEVTVSESLLGQVPLAFNRVYSIKKLNEQFWLVVKELYGDLSFELYYLIEENSLSLTRALYYDEPLNEKLAQSEEILTFVKNVKIDCKKYGILAKGLDIKASNIKRDDKGNLILIDY